jgi:hypothetical protein
MPNGHGRNLSRLMMALEGFRALHGHWPKRVRLEQGYIDDFQNLLTGKGYQQLISKLSLVPDSLDGMRAEDDQGNSFTYGADPSPEIPADVKSFDWLGSLEMNPYDDEPF